MKLNILCIELRIIDDPDFGCTITLSDTVDLGYDEDQSIEDIINSKEKYFSIQRSYSEHPYENDFYSIETTESKVEPGRSDFVFFQFFKNEYIDVYWCGTNTTIGLKIEEQEIFRLKKTLQERFKKFIKIIEK